jgi:hypothetical protein
LIEISQAIDLKQINNIGTTLAINPQATLAARHEPAHRHPPPAVDESEQ